MRAILATTVILAALAASPAMAASAAQGAQQSTMKTCSATWTGMSDAAKKATTHKAFMSSCMSKSGGT
ncbi:MAG TPA: hypothetical protein VH000_07665, partial [Rhizomicrobium sp.]|nr:hypothetical protein [Rhizomicrobium sp.]